jgi:predicted ATP-grasp superfamily ATP-dependent carboligase
MEAMKAGPGPTPCTSALVTDVHLRSAVAGLRALGRAGIPVLALGPGRGSAGLWSRHARRRRVGPEVTRDPTGYLAAVANAARGCGRPVVYPGWEGALEALLDARDRLPAHAVVPYPENGAVQNLRDKRRLGELAADAGIARPGRVAEGTAGELRRAASVRPPCVVKPVTSVGALGSAHVVHTQNGLDALLAALPDDDPLIIQERVRGPLAAVAVVVGRDGALVARFQQIARQTWPPEAGVSSTAISVAPDEPFIARAAAMLARAGYWGLAQLQFVETDAGRVLIDANPRFYGSLPLALAAGVNLPAAWHAVAVGGTAPTPTPYRIGVGYRWLEGDLTAAARGERGRLRGRRPRPGAGAMWAADDPLPSVALALDAVWVRLRRRLHGRDGETAS